MQVACAALQRNVLEPGLAGRRYILDILDILDNGIGGQRTLEEQGK